jgi:predicted small lipoprotein YifL
MRIELKTLLGLLACVLLTTACGQKGPLYLPGRSSTFESMTPEQQPNQTAESAQEDSDEDDEERTDNIN